jgi:transcriptional regulator with PAS, ATPase and Fis domain
VIEKRQTSRVGATTVKPIDVRIVAATNANLSARVLEGSFRQDLLYRLNTIELHLPPLRGRGNDILLLAQHFMAHYSDKYRMPTRTLTKEEEQLMLNYSWPGNVRELQHAVERSVVMNLPITLMEPEPTEAIPALGSLNLEELERQAIHSALQRADGNLSQAAVMLGITRYALYRKISKIRSVL